MVHFSTPELITMNTNDVQQIQLFVQVALTMMVMAPIMGVGGILMALREDVHLSLVIVVVVPLMALVLTLMIRTVVPRFQSMQLKIDKINQILREQITGIRVIRAFLKTKEEEVRFEGANADLTATALSINRVFALAMPALMAILNLSTVAVVWFGGHLISNGQMPVGNLVAFITYISQIFFSVMIAVFVVVLLPRAIACADRIEGVLATETTVKEPTSPTAPATRNGRVDFKQVDFAYFGGEEPVLHDLNFTIEAHKTTAIIGGTGSGKTTLVNLIPRFFDPTVGSVEVNGVDVCEQELESLWRDIGIVPQASYLFAGSVAENLRFGRPEATDEELWKALEIAQGKQFVSEMPDGLDSPIEQGGTNVSGGQRQRLCIARALVKRPSVYLFDDCFSALDAATDARLRGALKSELSGATVVIVAQRVSTIMGADEIIVLDDGRVVGVGTHGELMESCNEYKEIVESQQTQGAA
jgi:ATP-binding cassette subfamily B protein